MKNITRRGFVKGAAIAPLVVSHLGLGSNLNAQEVSSTTQGTSQASSDRFDISRQA